MGKFKAIDGKEYDEVSLKKYFEAFEKDEGVEEQKAKMKFFIMNFDLYDAWVGETTLRNVMEGTIKSMDTRMKNERMFSKYSKEKNSKNMVEYYSRREKAYKWIISLCKKRIKILDKEGTE